LTTLLMFLPRISGGYSCAFRIQEFLLLGEVPERIQDEDVSPEKSRPRQLHDIKLSKATLQGHDGKTIFENVNFSVRGEQITMIIGPVGCGKSCLLRVILGELQLSGGTVAVTPAEIAYCDQDPWLQNMSIRDNIIAQSNYNSSWYKDVLHACALDEDLKQLSEGDQTVVGTNGCNLSGGQRQRVVSCTNLVFLCVWVRVLAYKILRLWREHVTYAPQLCF
jgi:ABC-type bacteriocin/lantibiotic exporter with double-glycine peptidase domain